MQKPTVEVLNRNSLLPFTYSDDRVYFTSLKSFGLQKNVTRVAFLPAACRRISSTNRRLNVFVRQRSVFSCAECCKSNSEFISRGSRFDISERISRIDMKLMRCITAEVASAFLCASHKGA